MNWTDEEIDKLFQESASQMNVPYQDAFWSEVEAMLPQKKQKKGLLWIFGGTLTSFALIAAMIFPGNQFSSKESKATASAVGQRSIAANVQTMLSGEEQSSQVSDEAIANNSGQVALFAGAQKTGNIEISRFTSNNSGGSELLIAPKSIISVDIESNENAENISFSSQEEDGTDKLELLVLPSELPEIVPQTYSKFTPRSKKNTLYAQIGFGSTQSYISGSEKNWMTSVNLGGGYQYSPQGFGFSAGVNFSGSFSNNLEITRRSKVYNFGSTNYEQNLMYRQLYSIELPVTFDYRKDKYIVSLGVAPTYLASTVMRFSQFVDNELSTDGVYFGQKVGLNSFGLKAGVGYQIEVAKSWNVGIQLNAQMIKQVDETQFVGSLTKMPLSGQITIRKTFTRKFK